MKIPRRKIVTEFKRGKTTWQLANEYRHYWPLHTITECEADIEQVVRQWMRDGKKVKV